MGIHDDEYKEEELKVGSQVQYVEWESRFIFDGTIESVIPSKKPCPSDAWDRRKYTDQDRIDFTTFAKVKWNDGSEEELDIDDLSPRDSDIERSFRRTYFATMDRIQEKMNQASSLIQEAVKISEEAGVPFSARVSPLRNSYFPRSQEDKFPGLDSEFVSEVTETYNEYECTGWRHSAVC